MITAIIDTQHGPVQVERESDHYAWQRGTTTLRSGSYTVTLETPGLDEKDPDVLAAGAELAFGSRGYLDAEDLEHMALLLGFGRDLVHQLNAALADGIAEARKQQALERVERERQEAERAATWEARKEQLLNELVEEKGRIRLRGMKRWRPVTVQVEQYVSDEYTPVFIYVYDKHGYKERNIERVASFEIKVGSRYKSVWNDGDEDLPYYDRSEKTAGASAQYDGDLA